LLSFTNLLGLGALLLSSATGCGASAYQASGGVKFDVDSAHQIDDDDVAKAFAAKPQLADKSRVAYYAFDDKDAADVEGMLAKGKHVSSVYRIPPLLLTGKRRFQESRWDAAQEISIKKLRLLAARANADVLVVFDHGWRGGGANGLAALNVLLVPILFVPFLSNETETYAQAYVIDVRNGFLYGEASAEKKAGSGYVNVWQPNAETLATDLWPKLLDDVKVQLDEKLAPSQGQAVTAPPAPPAR
jgi:hypothetical protein